jgi:hypothetical protein
MFRIFRTVRSDILSTPRSRNYLLYATGEFVLVVVGILIALQINNWNEDRQEQRQIAEYARALIDDLQADIKMVEPIIVQTTRVTELADGLASYVRTRNIEEIDNLDLYYLTSYTSYRPYSWNRAALQQLINSGALRQMKNGELVRHISNYDGYTRHLDEDYAKDTELGKNAQALAGEIVDQNYPVRDGTDSLRWMSPYSFPSVELHDVYSDVDLQLLTDDIRKVRAMVNYYNNLGSYASTRYEHELPTLKDRARQLIELLESEYPK